MSIEAIYSDSLANFVVFGCNSATFNLRAKKQEFDLLLLALLAKVNFVCAAWQYMFVGVVEDIRIEKGT